MQIKISRYFLRLLTVTVLLAVTLIGSLWFWDTYQVYRRDIDEIRTSSIRQQRRELKQQVAFALKYISFMQHKSPKNIPLKEKERIKSEILNWLQHYRWDKNNRNYIFIGNYDGVLLAGPPEVIGKNMLGVTDIHGVHIVREFIRLAQNGGGYLQYVMPKFKNIRPMTKISYIGSVPEYHWFIGTGRYIDDIKAVIAARKQQLKKEFISHILQICLLFLLLSTLILIIIFIVSRRVRSNLEPFVSFFHQASSNFVQIQEDKLNFDEFRLLAGDANAMLRERDKIQKILRRQENLLKALTRAGHQLLSGADPEHAVTGALAILGKACSAERVYLFEIEEEKGSGKTVKLRYEWTDNVSSRLDDPRFQHISQTLLKSRWAAELRQGHAVQGSVDDFSGEVADLSREYGVKTILLLPVIYRGRFWGVLGCDTCKEPVHWPSNSIQSLQSFASTLCTAIMQRRSEQEATRIRDQWVTTFNSIKDAIFLLDTDNRIVNANAEALRIAGVNDLAEIQGKNLPNILHGKGTRFKACLAELTLEQGIPLSDEVHSSKLDKFFFSSSFPVYHQEGKLAGVIYIARDVTREKNMEQQLIQARKMEALGTLAGGIAHDFNNILAAIMGFSELALVKLQHKETVGLDDDISQILRAGKRAKELIAQLLAFSRNQESRKAVIKGEPILEETIHMLGAFVPANIQVVTQLSPETRTIFADPTALHQVFMNLGSNGAQAMKDKGGRLLITLEETTLSREQQQRISDPAASYLHIVFSDQGGGVDPRIVDKIYDPFFTTKEVGEGTGMGLAAVHGIIEDHDGFMELENKPGVGATFHVYLPQTTKTDTQRIASVLDQQNPATRTFNLVLIVDDEAMLLAMYKDMFSLLGCDTLTTPDPNNALELLKNNPEIDLLCTDYDMPKMNGLELARQCHILRQDLPILLNSGLQVDLDSDAVQRAGVSEILTKPVALQKLQKTLLLLAERKK